MSPWTMRVWNTCLVAGFLIGGGVASADPFTEALIADLEASGFQVNKGYPKVYGLDECIDQTYPAFKNCFQANPAAPYLIPVVKSWPDEYVDPATVNAFVVTDPGYSATYRLDRRDAILIYGQMPPPGRYMGLQTWQFSQRVPGGEYCVPIPDDLLPPDEGDPSLRRTFTIALRGYIAPGTQTGPDSRKLLAPRIFTFAPRR